MMVEERRLAEVYPVYSGALCATGRGLVVGGGQTCVAFCPPNSMLWAWRDSARFSDVQKRHSVRGSR